MSSFSIPDRRRTGLLRTIGLGACLLPGLAATEADIVLSTPETGPASATDLVIETDMADTPVPWRPATNAGLIRYWGKQSGRPNFLLMSGYARGFFRHLESDRAALDAESNNDRTVNDFGAQANLTIGSEPTEWLRLFVELDFNDEEGFNELEQAIVRWYVREDLAINVGKFHQWFGWEQFDAPDLWRINSSFNFYNSGEMTGASLYWTPWDDGEWRFEAYVVDEIITPASDAPGKENADLGYGAAVRYQPSDKLLIRGAGFYDVNTAPSVTDDDGFDDVAVADINVEWRVLDLPLEVAMDLAWGSNPDGQQVFLLTAGRWFWTPTLATTLMYNALDENYDREAIERSSQFGRNLFNNQRYEYAAAMQWWPEDLAGFRISAEYRYIDSTVREEDEWGVFLEMLAIAPGYWYRQ